VALLEAEEAEEALVALLEAEEALEAVTSIVILVSGTFCCTFSSMHACYCYYQHTGVSGEFCTFWAVSHIKAFRNKFSRGVDAIL
jgi:hypothetical protein